MDVKCKVVNARFIRSLLEKEKAAFVLEVQSSKTWYSKCFVSYTGAFEPFKLLAGCVKDTVILKVNLVVMKSIRNFSSSDFISDYEGIAFNFQPGDVIGIGDTREIPVIYNKEEVKKGKPIIKFDKAPDNKLRVSFDDEEAIHVILPEEVFIQLSLLQEHGKRENEKIINSILIVPALMQVLQVIVSSKDSAMVEAKWYKSIVKRLQGLYGGQWQSECQDEPMRVAEAILHDVYIEAIKVLE